MQHFTALTAVMGMVVRWRRSIGRVSLPEKERLDPEKPETRVHSIALLLLAGFVLLALLNLEPWLLVTGLLAAGILELVGWLRG